MTGPNARARFVVRLASYAITAMAAGVAVVAQQPPAGPKGRC